MMLDTGHSACTQTKNIESKLKINKVADAAQVVCDTLPAKHLILGEQVLFCCRCSGTSPVL